MRMVICEKPGREHWHEGPEVVCNDGESIGRPALSSSDPKSHPHPRSLLSSQTKKKRQHLFHRWHRAVGRAEQRCHFTSLACHVLAVGP